MSNGRMLVVLVTVVAALGTGRIDKSSETRAVERAVLDYVEALYEVKPELIDRGVHSELAKRGFGRNETGEYRESTMSFAQLRSLAERWNARGRVDPKAARKEVVVLDVLDKTASAKLVASWGIDYMHLAKYDGEWKIVNVLWQAPPAAVK